ncbi:MAG: hypothetical protein C4341_05015 [Armatimonadota bacterium]
MIRVKKRGAGQGGDPLWQRLLLFGFLLFLASNRSEHPASLVVVAGLVVLGYLSDRLALAVLFGSLLLPYVAGLPVTLGYVLIVAMAPYSFLHPWKVLTRAPRPFLYLSMFILLGSVAMFAFTKALFLVYLCASVLLAWEAFSLVRRSRLGSADITRAARLGLGATVVVPLLFNAALPLVSPFWFPSHTPFLILGRFTVSVFDELLVSGYLLALFAATLFSVEVRRSRGLRWMTSLFLLLVAVEVGLTGSRAALLGLAFLLALPFFIARAKVPSIPPARYRASVVLIAVLGVAAVAVLVGSLQLPAIKRLAEMRTLASTGRPQTVAWALPSLNEFPMAPIIDAEYLRRGPPLVPHFAPVAAALFFGIPVAALAIALFLIPVVDLFRGARLCRELAVVITFVALLVMVMPTPDIADRGTFLLLGAWYALSRVPTVAGSGAAIRVLPASV